MMDGSLDGTWMSDGRCDGRWKYSGKQTALFAEIFLEFYPLYLIHRYYVKMSIKVTLLSSGEFLFCTIILCSKWTEFDYFPIFVYSTKKTTIS